MGTFLSLFLSCNPDEEKIDIPKFNGENKAPENSDIPYFVISTGDLAIQDEPKIPANMAIFVEGEEVFKNPIGIEYRGSTSQKLFPKKSFGIETWDNSGQDISLQILGFPKEEDWILQAAFSDKTLMRNALIYQLSNDIGMYAVKTQFAEVEVNGEYQGVYSFMEKIKRDRSRLDLMELEPGQNDSQIITGGYILKIDKTTGDTENSGWEGDFAYRPALGFRSNYDTYGGLIGYPPYGAKQSEETYFLYEYPDQQFINEEQKAYIQNYINSFESALASEDFLGQTREYLDYIDVNSFVDFFILNEISANPDAYRLSTFLHKDRDGKLKMGPIWDFNIAFGNDGRSAVDLWIYQYNLYNPGDLWLVHFWWTKLLSDPIFRTKVKERWNQLKGTELSVSRIHQMIDDNVNFLNVNGAVERNYEKWDVIGQALPFNSFVGASYEEEINYLKDWYSQRYSWMDSQIQSW